MRNRTKEYIQVINNTNTTKFYGNVNKVVGLTIESRGPEANVGELCRIQTNDNGYILAEVVGFNEENVLLMPLGDIRGVGPGNLVISNKEFLKIGVSKNLIGRVLNGLGEPIDNKGKINFERHFPIERDVPHPLNRNRIDQPLYLGIKSIDGLLTLGKGQRIGIFAGSGVGKSTLLGMITRNALSDINVIALIGERGREVNEFLERDLGPEGLARSIVVVATSDQPALIRLKAAFTATVIAEYFRDLGKDVLLMMDSLTRFAMAQREIGLATGEPPISRGYTPSVFSVLPKLLERAGQSKNGSITGIYTVLVDGDDFNEPITDAARGILDGHIVLSRKLASQNQYPAIDILDSVSRVMKEVVDDRHIELADKFKSILATYRESEDLINIGAYVKGSNPKIDYAVKHIEHMRNFIKQDTNKKYSSEKTIQILENILK
jgi:flagellum-specific ATP synthase